MNFAKHWLWMACLAGGMAVICNPLWAAEEKKEDEAKEHAEAKAVLSVAKTTLAAAVKTAMEKVPDGRAFRAETEQEKEAAIFEVHLLVGDKVKEVEIDAATGKVLEVQDDDDESADEVKEIKQALDSSKTTLLAAIEAAVAGKQGAKAFKAEIELEKGKVEIEVEYFDGDAVMEAYIDPANGKVLIVENDDDDD